MSRSYEDAQAVSKAWEHWAMRLCAAGENTYQQEHDAFYKELVRGLHIWNEYKLKYNTGKRLQRPETLS